MSEWKKVRLGDVCKTNIASLTPKDKYDYINYLDTGNITNNYIDNIQKLVVAEDKIPSRAKRKVQPNDIVFSNVRPNQRHLGLLKQPVENMIVSTGFTTITAKNGVAHPQYLYYFLSQDNIINSLQVIAEQSVSTYPSLKSSDIENLEINLPPLEEQERIAKILGSLDDKIELNNKINRNLEAQAEALFKQWFVDFDFPDPSGNPYRTSGGAMIDSPMGTIPNGWSIGDVGDYCKVKSGFAFKSSWWQDSGVKVLKIKNINSDGSVNLDDCSYVAENKKVVAKDFMLKAGDLIIAMTGATIGKFAIIPQCNEVLLANQRVGKFFLGDNPIIKLPYLYCFLKQESVFNEIVNKGQGSAQPNISPTDIETISIIYNHKVIEQYNKLCFNLFCEILNKTKENASLAELRDALQPKLMNNDIRL